MGLKLDRRLIKPAQSKSQSHLNLAPPYPFDAPHLSAPPPAASSASPPPAASSAAQTAARPHAPASSTAQAATTHTLASASSAVQAATRTRPCFLLHSRHPRRRGFDAPASSAAAARPSLSRGPSLPLSPPSPRADVPAAEATDIRASAAVPAHPQRLGYRLPPRRGGTPPPSD